MEEKTQKKLVWIAAIIAVLWIGSGVVSFFLEMDNIYLILTHLSFLVIVTYIFVLLLITHKSKHAKEMLELEIAQKLWEEMLRSQRNQITSAPKKDEPFKRIFEVVKNLRRKDGDVIDNDLLKAIETIELTIDKLVNAENKLKDIETTQNQ